ncbi:MAG: hypothetical protein ACRD10_06265 [Terriglobia bacterium]
MCKENESFDTGSVSGLPGQSFNADHKGRYGRLNEAAASHVTKDIIMREKDAAGYATRHHSSSDQLSAYCILGGRKPDCQTRCSHFAVLQFSGSVNPSYLAPKLDIDG